VSVLRGSGAQSGKILLDDYIRPSEPVVDYMTRFSGIRPGDLEGSTPRHHVSTLKPTYLKLRRLVDAGVVFVGHGLKQDFRIISTPRPAPVS
jgi:PAB-dependent poly(A)-specific ribonuclease subunit 2